MAACVLCIWRQRGKATTSGHPKASQQWADALSEVGLSDVLEGTEISR